MSPATPALPGASGNTNSQLAALSATIAKLGEAAKKAVDKIGVTDAVKGVDALGSQLLGQATAVASAFVPVLTIVTLVTQTVAAFFTALFRFFEVLQQLFQFVRYTFETLFAVIKGLVNILISLVQTIVSVVSSVFSFLTETVSTLTNHINTHFGTIIKYALGAAAVIGGAFIAAALAAEHAWTPVAQTIGRLKIAGVVDDLQDVIDFSEELSRVTTMAASSILEISEKARTLKIAPEQLKAATAAAIGLAAALGISASDALEKLKGKSGEAFDTLKDKAQQGLDLASEKIHTFAGFWQQLKNVLAQNAVALGERIAPGIAKIVDALRPLLAMLESTGDGFAAVFNSLADTIAPVIETAVEYLQILHAGFFASLSTIKDNWTSVWELIKTTLEYALLFIKNVTVQFFTVTLPAYFNWFVEFGGNWIVVLAQGLQTGFVNMFVNLAGAAKFGFAAMMNQLLGGDFGVEELKAGMSAMWTKSLTEGFKGAKMPELPEVAGRIVSPIENALRERIKELGGAIGVDFTAKFEDNLANLKAKMGDVVAAKDEIGNLKPFGAKGGSEGSGNTLLESRFLSRGTGLSTTDTLLARQIALAEQEASDRAAEKAEIERHNKEVEQGMADGKALIAALLEPVS